MKELFISLFLRSSISILMFYSATVSAQYVHPEACDQTQNGWVYRCNTKYYSSMGVIEYSLKSNSSQSVDFKISNWASVCGRPGDLTFDKAYTLNPNTTLPHCSKYRDPNPGYDNCNEVYVYQCSQNGQSVPCSSVLTIKLVGADVRGECVL
ncbi:hypothetical protein [Iodobacter fluviatilis]|uniref:Uncharacterized protein n=1 Tax=Iodobacter fluviatilis TaxID=537 RepID=A0A377Q9V2_9NEIS|nr:hypothetical protein [Iodobacter fluviatilis]TCU82437.1 hypothetical protein EV682_11576 [Iodobacter fluviatilis]STQ91662.1 Uncharacterised protein [Iodobacter fluviatilis]